MHGSAWKIHENLINRKGYWPIVEWYIQGFPYKLTTLFLIFMNVIILCLFPSDRLYYIDGLTEYLTLLYRRRPKILDFEQK